MHVSGEWAQDMFHGEGVFRGTWRGGLPAAPVGPEAGSEAGGQCVGGGEEEEG